MELLERCYGLGRYYTTRVCLEDHRAKQGPPHSSSSNPWGSIEHSIIILFPLGSSGNQLLVRRDAAMESQGKARRQQRNICVCSFLERGLGLGMAPIPEFSWKFYLLLNHDPSLKLIGIFSISAFVSCWCCWVLGEHLELQGQVRMELPSTELAEQGAMLSITSSSC